MGFDQSLQNYFYPKKVLSVSTLSKGLIGEVKLVTVDNQGKTEKYALKSLISDENQLRLPHDQFHIFASSYYAAKNIKEHAPILDIIGLKEGKMTSDLPKEQYFQLIQFQKGELYSQDLARIREKNDYTSDDEEKVRIIAKSLANTHKQKVDLNDAQKKIAYYRFTREMVAHSEVGLPLYDWFEGKNHWFSKSMEELFITSWRNREKVKKNYNRLSFVHGDCWHPNMLFDGKNLGFIDASRYPYGDPAIDVALVAFGNYFINAAVTENSFTGVFNDLGQLFMKEYIHQSDDEKIAEFMPLCLSSVLPVIILFSLSKSNLKTQKMVYQTCINGLKKGKFNWKNLNK